MSARSPTPKSDANRRRILEAATVLFQRYGYRKTTVSLLAAEAEVAKPTIYAHFEDKEAVFRAVIETVCEQMREAAEKAKASKLPVEERLIEMLAAKFTRHFELVHSSAHARELIDSEGKLGSAIIERADRAFTELLTEAIDDGGLLPRSGVSAAHAATLLLRAASGADYDAANVAAHRRNLGEIVRTVVAGLRSTRR